MINNIRLLLKSTVKALPLILVSSVLAGADTLFNSEWSNPDGSKSQSTVTFYENIGPEGKVGHYAGSTRNRLVGKYSSDYTVFEGYWVKDDSSQQCSYSIDGSQFYGRVFLTSSDGKEFDGLWGYCDEAPNLRWQGWIAAISEESSSVENKLSMDLTAGFCEYEGVLVEPVFYCTFGNKKSLTVCEAYNDNGDWNSFSYKYGNIGQESELELKAEMPKSYFPTVVAKTTIEAVSPFCTTGDGDPCETNHSLHYDFRDTSSQFLFENGDYEYLINASSWLGASFRAYEGNLKVNKIKRNLPNFHPQYRSNITSIVCDQSSVKNSVWDGTYVDEMINKFSLCWVDMGDEEAEWQQCLP